MQSQGKQKRLVPLSISLAVSLEVFKPCIWEEDETFNFPALAN